MRATSVSPWLATASRSPPPVHRRIGLRQATIEFRDQHVQKTHPPFVIERYGRLPDLDRSFDIEYWQRLGPAAIFEAAWQMVVDAHEERPGGSDELRLRRTVEQFQSRRS